MGEPIARRLLHELGELTVWNRTAAKTTTIAAAGAQVATTPAEAAAPITLTVLTDLSDVEDVLDGDAGLLAGWSAQNIDNPVLVVHGTVSPLGVAALARRLAPLGVSVVDAPLSGGVVGAETGSLSVMAGGDTAALERVLPVLRHVGSTVINFGPVGSGEIAKACNQVVVAATVTAISEALVLADAAGVDRSQLLTVLGGGLAASEVLRQKQSRWLSDDYENGGSADNQLKDLRFVSETAASSGLTLPLASALSGVFEKMVDAGLGALDHSAVVLSIADQAPSRNQGVQ